MFQLEIPSTLPYLLIVIALLVATFAVLRSRAKLAHTYLLCFAVYAAVTILIPFKLGANIFDCLRLLCIGLFAGGFALFAIFYGFARSHFKLLSVLFVTFDLLILIVGVDAFLIEPGMIEIRRASIISAKISKPIKIGVLSDLQTDRVSEYEEHALKLLIGEKPDLILLPGDFVQSNAAQDAAAKMQEMHRLNDLLIHLKLSAPLGVYAVHGNVEDDGWTGIFSELPVKCFAKTETILAHGLAISGLTLEDSFDTRLKLPHTKEFHIVVGHAPDFELAKPDADLLVAGHTHGGQVQIPFFGAPITFSRVPREIAAGSVSEIYPGTTLALTRGAGLERGLAPRLRFFCHPEIMILTIVPLKGPLTEPHQR